MRISVTHNKTREHVKQSIESALSQAMTAMPSTAVEVSNFERSWRGSTMTFSLDAKAGFLRKRIQGALRVTDSEVILDAELGLLEKLFPMEKFKDAIQHKVDQMLS